MSLDALDLKLRECYDLGYSVDTTASKLKIDKQRVGLFFFRERQKRNNGSSAKPIHRVSLVEKEETKPIHRVSIMEKEEDASVETLSTETEKCGCGKNKHRGRCWFKTKQKEHSSAGLNFLADGGTTELPSLRVLLEKLVAARADLNKKIAAVEQVIRIFGG